MMLSFSNACTATDETEKIYQNIHKNVKELKTNAELISVVKSTYAENRNPSEKSSKSSSTNEKIIFDISPAVRFQLFYICFELPSRYYYAYNCIFAQSRNGECRLFFRTSKCVMTQLSKKI